MLKKSQKFEVDKSAIAGRRIAIVRSLYNEEITESLLKNCVAELEKNGIDKELITVYEVPGAMEIPLVAKLVAQQDLANVIIALGVIIKGETYHFEMIATECARGCTIVAQEFGIPVIFEVLAVYSLAQAKARAGNDENNKGLEAAQSALKMLEVMSGF